MQMGAGREAALARGVTDAVAGLEPCPYGHAVVGRHVQVENIPAGRFLAVAIQIDHNLALVATHHDARRRGCYPKCRRIPTTAHSLRAGDKVEGGPGAAAAPRAMRPTGKKPMLATGPGQLQFGLLKVCW